MKHLVISGDLWRIFVIFQDTAVPFRSLPVRIGSAYSNRLTLSREQSC